MIKLINQDPLNKEWLTYRKHLPSDTNLIYSLYCLQGLQKAAFTKIWWKTQSPQSQKLNSFPRKIVTLWTKIRSSRYENSGSEYFNLVYFTALYKTSRPILLCLIGALLACLQAHPGLLRHLGWPGTCMNNRVFSSPSSPFLSSYLPSYTKDKTFEL